MDINDRIRDAMTQRMTVLKLTQADLARKLGVKPPHVSRVLARQAATVPDSLVKALDALDLELTVKEKDGA